MDELLDCFFDLFDIPDFPDFPDVDGLPDSVPVGDSSVWLPDLIAGMGVVALTAAAVAAGAAVALAVANLDCVKKFFRELFPKMPSSKAILDAINEDPDAKAWLDEELKNSLRDAPTISINELEKQVTGKRRLDNGEYVVDFVVYHPGSAVGCPFSIASKQNPTEMREGLIIE